MIDYNCVSCDLYSIKISTDCDSSGLLTHYFNQCAQITLRTWGWMKVYWDTAAVLTKHLTPET